MHYHDTSGTAGTGIDKWYYWYNEQFVFVSQTSDTLPDDPAGTCWAPARGMITSLGSAPTLSQLSQSYGGPKGIWKTEFFFEGTKIGERTFKIS